MRGGSLVGTQLQQRDVPISTHRRTNLLSLKIVIVILLGAVGLRVGPFGNFPRLSVSQLGWRSPFVR